MRWFSSLREPGRVMRYPAGSTRRMASSSAAKSCTGAAVTSTRSSGSPHAVAVNPVTNEIYVANLNSANVTVIDEQQVKPIPIDTSIAPLAGNVTYSATPSFTFTATNGFTTGPIDNLLF